MPINLPSIFLNLGFPHADFVDERYIRLPLWMLEIDWFGCDVEKIQNPKPLPLDICLKPMTSTSSEDRNRFCAFVVTNPCNPVRNNAFHWLNQYKKVDSAGRLFNTVGDEIFAGLGGGGGSSGGVGFLGFGDGGLPSISRHFATLCGLCTGLTDIAASIAASRLAG